MPNSALLTVSRSTLADISKEGLTKRERPLSSAQGVHVEVQEGEETVSLLNFCANNYLGLANHKVLVDAAFDALKTYGLGMASVRFICGTNTLHTLLERKLATFLGMEDAILFSSCFDANAGVFEALLGADDVIISDSLNHASLIDGIRLCKAQRYRYANNAMDELESHLQSCQGARLRMIVTDGVFSMDGIIANLPKICDLAEQYNAAVLVDDSHAVGFMGETGAGTHQYHGVMDRIDLLTGTFGKALGGAAGGYVAGKKPYIDLLRQRARPYLFSNALPPVICGAAIACLDYLKENPGIIQQVHENARYFREKMTAAGFELAGSDHPIIPVLLKDAPLAVSVARRMAELGVYVTAFSFPVVPRGEARIRTQMSSAHTREDLDKAIAAFIQAGQELKVIP